jgi:hypothetical protein
MARAMSLMEFTRFAREQIDAADATLAGSHRYTDVSCGCSCGRPWPCCQAVALRQRSDHFRCRLVLAEQTALLPVETSPMRTWRR